MGYEDDFYEYEEPQGAIDSKELEAIDYFKKFFEKNKEEVFFSRQLEVQHEHLYFHWITNRALRELRAAGHIRMEVRQLGWGGSMTLLWHKSYRYPKRKAQALVDLVEEYSAPEVGTYLGLQGETMVLDGFSKCEFIRRGRNTREFGGKKWTQTEHNLDFIFERNGIAYGIEVKNTLGYMNHDELVCKISLCLHLGIRPVFVVRMIPKSWIYELRGVGGFALILKYQLYPWTHKSMALRMAKELSLPIDAPKELYDSTMLRFVRWHEKNM